MNKYFYSVIFISVILSAVSILLPSEKKSGKYVKFIVGAVTLLTLLSPVTGEKISLPEFELPHLSDSVSAEENLIQSTKKLFEREIVKELFTRFRISEEYCSAYVSLNSDDIENVYVEVIRITLKSYGAWSDTSSIKDFFAEKYSCSVKVTYE